MKTLIALLFTFSISIYVLQADEGTKTVVDCYARQDVFGCYIRQGVKDDMDTNDASADSITTSISK